MRASHALLSASTRHAGEEAARDVDDRLAREFKVRDSEGPASADMSCRGEWIREAGQEMMGSHLSWAAIFGRARAYLP